MRHLITGGAGFIGSHLADALVDGGDEVIILDDLSTGRRENVQHLLDAGSAELVEGSVLDEAVVDEVMARADSCFHLAFGVGVQLLLSAPLESLLRNVRGARVVVDAAARRGRRFLFTSTSEIYGKGKEGAIHEESDCVLGPPTISRWWYATANTYGEELAFGYHRERGAETLVARLFNTVGPRQTPAYGMVLPRFVQQALAGEDLTVYGDGTQTRCFAHVCDTVDAIISLAGADAALGRAVNVGSRDEIEIKGLAERVIERSGSSSSIRFVPYEDAYEAGFEDLYRRMPDTSVLQRMTGWRPRKTLDDAIDATIAYEREALVAADALS